MMEASARPSRVLIVEDDAILARVYSRALVAAGFVVDLAADGAEGFERLLAGSYDVVLSDLRMPRLDGLDLLRQVQRMRPDVSVVLMTAALDNATYEAAREIMANVRCLAKPMTMERLARAVKSAASSRAARVLAADRRAPPRSRAARAGFAREPRARTSSEAPWRPWGATAARLLADVSRTVRFTAFHRVARGLRRPPATPVRPSEDIGPPRGSTSPTQRKQT